MQITARILGEGASGSAVAVRGCGRELTRDALRAAAGAWARHAATWPTHGGEPTPMVGLVCDDSPAFVAAFVGLADAGWAVGVLDAEWRDDELAGARDALDPSVVVATEGYRWQPPEGATAVDAPEGWRAWALAGATTPGRVRTPDPAGAFYVGFTSGSAGRPKAFMRSHRSWWESFEVFSAVAPLPAGDVVVPGGMSSSHFLFGALHALHAGATVELRAGVDDDLGGGDGPPAAMYVVPTMLAHASSRGACGRVPPRVFFCAGARLEAAVLAAVRAAFPDSTVVEYYGASELSFVALRRDGDATPPGSVGRPMPGVEVEIRGDNGGPVPVGDTGGIHVRSPLVFMGYRGTPPVGAAAPDADGWITVGDRGRVDSDGHLWVDGRGSALIVSGGANVQPEEVEEVVGTAPGVAACVVVGLDDAAWGQVVCAVVVAAPGAHLTRAGLRTHVGSSLSPYKRPRSYLVHPGPVPVGRGGKVDRDAVRRSAAQLPEMA